MKDAAVIDIAGYEVIISACDAERVRAYKWCKHGKKDELYFEHKTPRPNRKHILLHRFIVDCPEGMVVDHINLNTLDNRRSNLRICSPTENKRNCKINKRNTSGFKGVSWNKAIGKWCAFISVDGKNKNLSAYDDINKAYQVYCEASKKHHKDFGRVA
jgi:hypothetical protein